MSEVFDSCWGGTPHHFDEKGLSNCPSVCKVYECRYCKRKQTIHNSMYGCHTVSTVGDNTPIGA